MNFTFRFGRTKRFSVAESATIVYIQRNRFGTSGQPFGEKTEKNVLRTLLNYNLYDNTENIDDR